MSAWVMRGAAMVAAIWCCTGCATTTPLAVVNTPQCGRGTNVCCESDSQRVTQCSLFAGLTDLRQLSELPLPEYTTHMTSSFDRSSESAAPGSDAWFANRDFVTLEAGTTYTLLDVDGPGVVTRVWSAHPSGLLRVYLDGATTPVIEGPMSALLRGELAPIAPPFAFAAAGGGNMYLPIAYQTHCTITVTPEPETRAWRLYYQISVRSYARAVQVEPFTRALLDDPHGPAAAAARALARAAPTPNASSRFELSGAPARFAAEPGGSVLTLLRLHPNDDDPAALRETQLVITIDDEETVRAPLGDFFGGGPGFPDLQALPLMADPARRVLQSVWPMPISRTLVIALERAGGALPLTAAAEVALEARAFGARSLLFHAHARPAEWHPDQPNHAYNLITIAGDGYYVGTELNVTNTEAGWWGEGDEQVWIDGEAFPSFFGTGTEDYFGYAYCSNQRFAFPYIGQTRASELHNFGRSSLYRFHVPDPLRFADRLRFDFEVNHWGKTGGRVAFDSVAYFYARPRARVESSPLAATPPFIPELNESAAPEGLEVGPYQCGGG